MSVIVIEDGNLSRAIRQLKKQMAPEFSQMRLRDTNPKRSERKRVKAKKAERRRNKLEYQSAKNRERYLKWQAKQREATPVDAPVVQDGEGGSNS